MTAQSAWVLATREKRTVLRKAPDCVWWPYVWSQRTFIKVGSDGRVPIGSDAFARRSCPRDQSRPLHAPDHHFSILLKEPNPEATPRLLFTNRP